MTKYHRYCASSPDHRCKHMPDCDGPCHFDNAGLGPAGWRGQNLPISMKPDWLDDIKDFAFAVIYWAGTIALAALVLVAAGFAFGWWL